MFNETIPGRRQAPRGADAWHGLTDQPQQKWQLADLKFDQCRWPLGRLLAPPKFFCGEPRERLDLPSNPYCAYHRRMAVRK